jgi:L-amino acid N-acyltransferase YncA
VPEGIADRVATLDEEPHPESERLAWLRGRTPRHPVLAAVAAGQVIGWASLNPFNARAAYRHVADISVYVARRARGTGVGSLLLAELVRRARALGYHKLVLSAFPFNRAGMALYRKFGFTSVGIYHEQGRLDGRWVDTVVMERIL